MTFHGRLKSRAMKLPEDRVSSAFSKSAASRSRSAVTSARRASATANLTCISTVSGWVDRSGPGWSTVMVRSMSGDGPVRCSDHFSRSSISICQVFLLSLIALKSPDASARMIELRPHPMRVAACRGDKSVRSMTGPCPDLCEKENHFSSPPASPLRLPPLFGGNRQGFPPGPPTLEKKRKVSEGALSNGRCCCCGWSQGVG